MRREQQKYEKKWLIFLRELTQCQRKNDSKVKFLIVERLSKSEKVKYFNKIDLHVSK